MQLHSQHCGNAVVSFFRCVMLFSSYLIKYTFQLVSYFLVFFLVHKSFLASYWSFFSLRFFSLLGSILSWI
uniref:Putative ovule protein n=1 Tax=Solanum chacoense TaxID=4108 RepID=A0A0V0HSB4_SOLCH